jgi:hypothetical protein
MDVFYLLYSPKFHVIFNTLTNTVILDPTPDARELPTHKEALQKIDDLKAELVKLRKELGAVPGASRRSRVSSTKSTTLSMLFTRTHC